MEGIRKGNLMGRARRVGVRRVSRDRGPEGSFRPATPARNHWIASGLGRGARSGYSRRPRWGRVHVGLPTAPPLTTVQRHARAEGPRCSHHATTVAGRT